MWGFVAQSFGTPSLHTASTFASSARIRTSFSLLDWLPTTADRTLGCLLSLWMPLVARVDALDSRGVPLNDQMRDLIHLVFWRHRHHSQHKCLLYELALTRTPPVRQDARHCDLGSRRQEALSIPASFGQGASVQHLFFRGSLWNDVCESLYMPGNDDSWCMGRRTLRNFCF